MLYSSEKNLYCAKQVLLPNNLLQLPTLHYGCNLQDSLKCELYTVSTTWLFFAISHLVIIMKSDSNSNPLYLNCTIWVAKECLVANLVMRYANFSWNCTTSIEHQMLMFMKLDMMRDFLTCFFLNGKFTVNFSTECGNM